MLAALFASQPGLPGMLPAALILLLVIVVVGAGLFWLLRQTNRPPQRPR